MSVALIPCLNCVWTRGGRLLGQVEVAPDDGADEIAAWVSTLGPLALDTILHSPDELAERTAQRLASELGARTKAVQDFSEVDLGLWAGLTLDEVRTRFATAIRQLDDAPLSVTPPDGEKFSDALTRLSKALRAQIAKRDGGVGIVLRPMALALAAHALSGDPLMGLLEEARNVRAPMVVAPRADAVADPA